MEQITMLLVEHTSNMWYNYPNIIVGSDTMPSVSTIQTNITKLSEHDLHDLFNYIGKIMSINTKTSYLTKDCRESRFAGGSVCLYYL